MSGRTVLAEAAWRSRIVGHAEVSPEDLVPNPRNWRTHPSDQQRAVAAAIGEVGWVAEVLVNQATGHVVDGHLRLELALSRKEPTVPVTYVELTEAEEQLVLATLDPLGAMATAEESALASLLEGLAPTDAALADLLADLAEQHRIARPTFGEPDEIPPVPAEGEVYVTPGSLWRLGEHRLACGDATDPEVVRRLMAGSVADCLWTDPPYGVEYVGKTRDRLRLANDSAESSDDVVARAFRIAPLAPSSPFYVAAPAGPRSTAFREAIASAGWRLRQELVWVKGTIVLGHSDYQYSHEPILYGYTEGPGRPGRGRHPGTHWYGGNAQSSVLEYPKPTANPDHPTAKPVGLVAQCLRNSTKPGDLVYEPFAGSGTTLIAAETLGRRCYALEIEPRYAQVVIERWQGVTGQAAEALDG